MSLTTFLYLVAALLLVLQEFSLDDIIIIHINENNFKRLYNAIDRHCI